VSMDSVAFYQSFDTALPMASLRLTVLVCRQSGCHSLPVFFHSPGNQSVVSSAHWCDAVRFVQEDGCSIYELCCTGGCISQCVTGDLGLSLGAFANFAKGDYYLLTYLLIPWSRVLLEKLTGLQLLKKFPAFYGTRRFITAFTSARHLSPS